MTTMVRSIVALYIFCFSSLAYSAGGCDSCLQLAINSASAKIEASLNTLNTTAKENLSATQALGETVKASNNALSTLMDTQHQLLMSGLSAAAIKMELSNTITADTVEKMNDHLATVISNAIEQQTKSQQLLRNRDLFGPLSQPISGDIAANRAPLFKEAYIELTARLDEEMLKFKNWLYLVETPDLSASARRKTAAIKIKELSPKMDLLANNVIGDEDVKDLLTLIKIMIEPAPVSFSSMDAKEQLNFHAEASEKLARFNILASEVLSRWAILSLDGWDVGYVAGENIDNKTSFLEMMNIEAQQRLLSEDWHLQIKSLNEVGLIREQIYQNDITNLLLKQLIEEERKALHLSGLQ